MTRPGRSRDQRGVVFPSPVVVLSVVAVGMAGVAYVATQDREPAEREVTTVAGPSKPDTTPRQKLPKSEPEKIKKIERVVQRGKVYVEVYNNSGITGLAGEVAGRAQTIGWAVVGADNWYGTVPGSTVYYPPRLKAAAKQLGLDLGIGRVVPAIDSMAGDRLTVVLTDDAA